MKSLHPLAAQDAPDRITHRRGIRWRRQDAAIAAHEVGIDERVDVRCASALAPANDIQRDAGEGERAQQSKRVEVAEYVDVRLHDNQDRHRNDGRQEDRDPWSATKPAHALDHFRKEAEA
jgi:hypothetical protein